MVTRETNSNHLSIQANNFGGLNTEASPLNIPINDSPYLLNVDVDVNGRILKRRGTRVFWKELTNSAMPVYPMNSNLGYSYIVSKLDLSLRVFEVDNDEAELVWSKPNVFRQEETRVGFTFLPGEEARLLMLHPRQAPVQLRAIEHRHFQVTDTPSVVIPDMEKFINSTDQLIVYVNNERVEVTGSVNPLTFDLTINLVTGSTGANAVVDVISFTWQWWAEAMYWFGDNFHRSLPRSGATLADQNVQIPDTIYSDLPLESEDYGIKAYATNRYDDRYVETQQPALALEYGFGDGSSYRFSADQSLTRSPFFLTFGKEANAVTINFNDNNIVGDIFQVPIHELESFDVVFLNSEYPGLGIGPYYVQKIDDNQFRLFTDPNLSIPLVPGTQPSITFTDSEVDTASNTLVIPGHPFPVGEVTSVVFDNTNFKLPEGLNIAQIYYVFALTASVLEVYFDERATRRVDLLPRPTRFFDSANVTITPASTITIADHLLFKGDSVRYVPTSTATPVGGIPVNTRLYVDVYSPNLISLFTDSALTALVNISSAGSGVHELRIDGGTHTIRAASGRNSTIEKRPLDKVDIVRHRQLPFNNRKGVLSGNVHISVDDVQSLWNSNPAVAALPDYSYYLYTNTDYNPITDGLTLATRVAFNASAFIGVPRNSIIRMVNTETKWTGLDAINTKYNFDNGSWVPCYGLGLVADYDNGYFPSTGAVYQSRLTLAGFVNQPLRVIFSGSSDLLSVNEFFQYFQITDDLRGSPADPLDIVIQSQDNDIVQVVVEWQRALYIFSQSSVYRTFAQEGVVTSTNKIVGIVSNQGVVNPRCVCITESTLLFLSNTGVYDINPILEFEYRAAEVSLKIRNKFGLTGVEAYRDLAWIAYDRTFLRVYVALPRESDVSEASVLLIYNTQQRAWTEYSSFYFFRTYTGIQYQDKSLGFQFMISSKLPCFNVFTRFNYLKYADFVETSLNMINTTPVFWTSDTFDQVFEYVPDLSILFLTEVEDIRIFTGPNFSTLSELTFKTQWEKTNDNRIRLLTNPGDGKIVVTPKIDGSYFGTLLWLDNILQSLEDDTFGTIDFSNACVCTFGIGYGDGESRPCEFILQPNVVGEVGFAYPAVYVSPPLTQELLSSFKRVKHLNIMFNNKIDRYTFKDINVFTQQPFDLVNIAVNDINVNLAIIYQTDNSGVRVTDIYDFSNLQNDESWSVFKEPLQGVGYSYQVVVWSVDVSTWSMLGYQVTGKPVGERHASGSRDS